MKAHIHLLTAAILSVGLTVASPVSRAAVISDPSPAANVWRANLASIDNDTYTFPDPGHLFSPASFTVETLLDDNTSNFGAPVGQLEFSSGTNLQVSSVNSRAGSVFGQSTFFRSGAVDTFLSMGAFYNNAISGGNNYLGIEIADTSGAEHYGWLQYSFAAYSNGTTAVVFDSGYLNDGAGASVVAGAVPEPSAIASAMISACFLAVGCRRRRSA